MSTNKVYGDAPNEIPLSEQKNRWEYADPRYQNGIPEDFRIDASMHSIFGASKVAADVMVQEYGRYFSMQTVCFRGGTLTGPAHSATELHGFLGYVMRCAMTGSPYTVFGYGGKQVRDAIHSNDLIRAFHESRGDTERSEVIVPDSSHGTNPATASMAGFKTITVKSDDDGHIDPDAVKAALSPRTAALMLTNPSTLGLFETNIVEVLEAVHEAGALAYMDGANMNAILGKFKPGQAGFDVMHFNTHKTFSTPHGGGGPGAGPVAVRQRLAPFLPAPRVLREADGTFHLEQPGERPTSIGRVRSYQGSVGVLVRAYAYLLAHGGPGLEQVSEDAVLAAFHILNQFDLPKGSIKTGPAGQVSDEITEWTAVSDLKTLRWYFRTREDQSIRMVDLKEAVAAAKGEVREISMTSTQPIVNASTDFMPVQDSRQAAE